jgi:hypothetical protein
LYEDVDRVLINGRMRILVVEDEEEVLRFVTLGQRRRSVQSIPLHLQLRQLFPAAAKSTTQPYRISYFWFKVKIQ